LKTAREDILESPSVALKQMKDVLSKITRADNARMFMISNSADRRETLEDINTLLENLDNSTKSKYINYAENERIIDRLANRIDLNEKPVYVGLVNNNTSNGVMVFTARHADIQDTSREAVLRCLSGKLYSGGGGHGLFMRTWGAGLAYSNGYSIGQRSGRVSYYAERCPDIAQTMRFVVDVLKNAEHNPELVDYSIAQIFGSSRAPSGYESRGEAMAADLIDGFPPEIEHQYRQKVLEIKDTENLSEELFNYMENAYGPVLIGYGQPLSESHEGAFFIIGPDEQFQSLEEYIGSVESPQKVYKLYPRDFWLII
jgi:Zn-dependent M16 (insulinase) family peptidase